MKPRSSVALRSVLTGALLAVAGFTLLPSCSNSNNGAPPVGIADEPVVGEDDPLPGVVVTIQEVRSGAGRGRARVGDLLEVDFTVKTNDGAPLELATFARGAIMVSGPTFNYQRVIASQGDVIDNAVKTALGTYTYRFRVAVPAVYEAPINDTDLLTEGELTGQPLLDGTYTVGIELRKDYRINDVVYRDPGNAAMDFLIGGASAVESREVVTLANCNQCHGELRAHGDNRNNLTNCLLCHTAGAEDKNVATAAGGTPGLTIDFKVMIHKIHAGKHLPSVNGVGTNPDGSRNYGLTPKPYEIVGYGNNVIDFSEVGFPVWPSMATGMPRDIEYGALGTAERSLENTLLAGAVDCESCHGDPDGAGPLPAPSQGELAYTQPSVASCRSCHDDWNPDFLYTANNQTMPAERDNATCKECHRPSGGALDVMNAHRHPLTDPAFLKGLVFDVQSVTDQNGETSFDAGDRVQVTMTIKDGAGNDVPATDLARMEAVLNGPTTNPNLVHFVRIYPDALPAGPSYTFYLPEYLYYEPVGTSTGAQDTFSTTRAPHWNVSGATTSLLLVTGTSDATTLAVAAPNDQNYVDVASGAGANFADGDYVLIDDGMPGLREYLRVQHVEGDRLWFSSLRSSGYKPKLMNPHVAGAALVKATTAAIDAADYGLDAVTGVITEVGTDGFDAGEVLVSYTSDFLWPATFPGTLNDSPDLDQSWGDWVSLPMLDGTYNLGIYGEVGNTFTVAVGGQNAATSYTEVSPPEVAQLLFGTATEVVKVARIDDAEGCNKCHTDLQFHGNHRRGVDSCLLCHGVAGAEDAATYVYPSGVASPGVTIDFRTMVHKIHHGKQLDAGANYQVAGFGGSGHSYEHVGFPFMPGETSNCTSCHGENTTAWFDPTDRLHPNAMLPTRSWRAACASCHDSAAEVAHIDANTSPSGGEACKICHGIGEDQDVRKVHTVK